MLSNFVFLADDFPVLEKLGGLAESYLYADPNACLYKMGYLAENMVNIMFELNDLKPPSGNDNTQANKLKILLKEKLISKEISDIFYRIRISRNEAVHAGYDSFEECQALLAQTHTLTVWFMQVYGDELYEPIPFVMPEDIRIHIDYHKLLDDYEKLVAELEKVQLLATSQRPHTHVHPAEHRRRAEKATRNLRLSEREVRYIIDEQLRKVGWEADTFNLRYARGTRPEKGRNLAIAEWPTDLTVCKWGYMDYALFAGLELVGVVEANAYRNDMLFFINNQCREYSMGVKEEHIEHVTGTWGEYKVPFLFATNGRAYLEQAESRSGVWFRDARSEADSPKVLQGWIGPQDLQEMLTFDVAAANQELSDYSYDLLRDKDGLSLRPYQIEAIEKAEAAVIGGSNSALLEMAAGTGKTRLVPGMIHRFLKSKRFKRILLLVDSATGGETPSVFKDVHIENYLSLEQIYDVEILGDTPRGGDKKIYISTVQEVYESVFLSSGEATPPVTAYDLIIADEACQGYDSDEYREVLAYFNAVKIVLTADAVQYAPGFSEKPVFTYSRNRAVAEGYLTDSTEQ
ncbi:MAG: DEAD/DEAH box helicase family protein [Symbiobacteriaceae bacterium]|nr:DEAD/DEAH box helicase family protein [Symbiobacteriaceae bacterium]